MAAEINTNDAKEKDDNEKSCGDDKSAQPPDTMRPFLQQRPNFHS